MIVLSSSYPRRSDREPSSDHSNERPNTLAATQSNRRSNDLRDKRKGYYFSEYLPALVDGIEQERGCRFLNSSSVHVPATTRVLPLLFKLAPVFDAFHPSNIPWKRRLRGPLRRRNDRLGPAVVSSTNKWFKLAPCATRSRSKQRLAPGLQVQGRQRRRVRDTDPPPTTPCARRCVRETRQLHSLYGARIRTKMHGPCTSHKWHGPRASGFPGRVGKRFALATAAWPLDGTGSV